MATWSLSAGSFPIFASKNWINEDAQNYGTFSASEMQALLERVIDGDPFSYWQGSTAVDGTEVTLTFSLNNGSAVVSRNFDLVILQNINWKNFIMEYSTDGVAWSTITGLDYTGSDNAATDLIVNIAAGLGAKYVRARITHTIGGAAKKKCGGIIVCLGALQLSMGFVDYEPQFRENVNESELGDGTVSREYIMRSAASYELWGASFDCPFVTAAEKDTLRQIKREGFPFILIPEPGDNKRDAFLCHFDGRWGQKYVNPNRNLGYLIPMKVKEVGSH